MNFHGEGVNSAIDGTKLEGNSTVPRGSIVSQPRIDDGGVRLHCELSATHGSLPTTTLDA